MNGRIDWLYFLWCKVKKEKRIFFWWYTEREKNQAKIRKLWDDSGTDLIKKGLREELTKMIPVGLCSYASFLTQN